MNVAQLQLALGRLTSPAAAEKPDLAGYEAQGEFPGWDGQPCPPDCISSTTAWSGKGALRRCEPVSRVSASQLWALLWSSH